MIYDHISNYSYYMGLHPNLDLALVALEQGIFRDRKLGRYELADQDVYYFLQENTLSKEAQSIFEYHRCYADIHFVIRGREQVSYGSCLVGEDTEFDKTGDIGFVPGEKWVDCLLDGDYFAIFLPGEIHQPNQWVGGEKTVRKCVFKVLIDD
ncbi:YhcH/YjgK/YiaL family protein [Streptococcus ruminantium]|uniref:YhcH/YjgK/YiaL family protein n=1 Tax=Streptococcus ruminantium TaxID=1917441 RepID=UPI00280FE924|nr:YhcH/YjgK/YiaL family protein [Streptococcus ruminantium]MDQ8836777.1 YhcH/YjgK/YiaL family protein [Streptococcus ruminantium]